MSNYYPMQNDREPMAREPLVAVADMSGQSVHFDNYSVNSPSSGKNTFLNQQIPRLTTIIKMLCIVLLVLLICYVFLLIVSHGGSGPSVVQQARTDQIAPTEQPDQPNSSSLTEPEQQPADQLQTIRNMTLYAWNAYTRSAWPHEALKPISRSQVTGDFGRYSGRTILGALTTLWVMGLKPEYDKASDWVLNKLKFGEIDEDVTVFEVESEYIGAMESAYALTGERKFINKAVEIARILKPAYETTSGIPYQNINPHNEMPHDSNPFLSYAAGQPLEYLYLANITNDKQYSTQMEKILQFMSGNHTKENGLYFSFSSTDADLIFHSSIMSTMFTLGREFYLNLLKSYSLLGERNTTRLELYREAMDEIEANNLLDTTSENYFARIDIKETVHSEDYKSMYFTGCYLGGMLSLGSEALKRAAKRNQTTQHKLETTATHHKLLGAKLAQTCQKAMENTKSGLPPAKFEVDGSRIYSEDGNYFLSPELAETNFILWRLTHEQKYRDSAWKMVQAINRHCKLDRDRGYASITNVDKLPIEHQDLQPPVFLSSTLKYLYLTFTDDSVLPLDQWVFNSEGHPLPILK